MSRPYDLVRALILLVFIASGCVTRFAERPFFAEVDQLSPAQFRDFLHSHPGYIYLRNSRGVTVLQHAVERGLPAHVEALLEAGAAVDETDIDGESPLHLAVKNRNPDIVRLLLAHRAPIDCKNRNGETPLDCAINACAPEILRLLLQAGAGNSLSSREIQSFVDLARQKLKATREELHRAQDLAHDFTEIDALRHKVDACKEILKMLLNDVHSSR